MYEIERLTRIQAETKKRASPTITAAPNLGIDTLLDAPVDFELVAGDTAGVLLVEFPLVVEEPLVGSLVVVAVAICVVTGVAKMPPLVKVSVYATPLEVKVKTCPVGTQVVAMFPTGTVVAIELPSSSSSLQP
jgi:hypothetical protein